MKRFIPLVLLLCTSCASITVTKITADGTRTEFRGISLFSNSVLKTIQVDGTTKTTSSLLKASGASTEPNPESITATAEALGTLIGKAAREAATK